MKKEKLYRTYRTLWEQRKRDRNRLLALKEEFKNIDKSLCKIRKVLSQIKEVQMPPKDLNTSSNENKKA